MSISFDGNFAKLLLHWHGSVWKAVWKQLLFYLLIYYCIRLLYIYAMTKSQQEVFECAILLFEHYTRYIPLTFLLGFYIVAIIKRWWSQFELIAWPDDLLGLVCMIISGSDEDSKLRRHAVARYLNLTAAMAWRNISVRVSKRFPTFEHLVAAGLMTEEEKKLCNSIAGETNVMNGKWFLPLQWTVSIVQEVIAERKPPPPLVSAFYNHLAVYRASFIKLVCYDWVCVPLVYTQVAAMATYGYFAFCLIGHQYLNIADDEKSTIPRMYRVDMYVPVGTILQFLFFVGGCKVGQDLMHPFGTDEDDFEMNSILDRNIQTSFSLVDQVSLHQPSIEPDQFWQSPPPSKATYTVPHTKLSSKFQEHLPKNHAFYKIKHERDREYLWNTHWNNHNSA